MIAMYYLVKEENDFMVIKVQGTNDGTYHKLQRIYDTVCGQFGRYDYAIIWRDFYNGKITGDELRIKLDI
jgi:hypothetical protein